MKLFYFILFIILYLCLIKQSHSKCQHFKDKLINSNEIINPNKNSSLFSNVIVKNFLRKINTNLVFGRIVYINNAQSTLNVLQPKNDDRGCANKTTYRTSWTANLADNCEVATNAGFFNTHTKECLGNLINDGKVYLNSGGIKNAHFGIKKNGSLLFGYVGQADVEEDDWQLLVGGVVWLVRDGKSAVDASVVNECADTQDTGSLAAFASVESARTAVGALADGTVVLVHIEGKTADGGINLEQLATVLIELGVVSAINLDGGGSATLVVNGSVVSYPTDGCSMFTCERPVSTVLCVRSRCPHACLPRHECIHGFCQPLSSWIPAGMPRYIIVALVVIILVLLSLIGLIVVQWAVVRWRRSRSFHWPSTKTAMLVLNDDDDYVHFDNQPLLDAAKDDEEELA